MSGLSHVGGDGRAVMVDVTAKPVTDRRAIATATLTCAAATLALVREGRTPKGAVIQTAELAGIMGAKRTAELIPLCHPLPLTKVAVTITADEALPGFRISAEAQTTGQTGVEMEALTAASIAALTLYDMLKAVDQAMVVGEIRLTQKRGGKRDLG